jgi:hypothetical protein
MDSYVNLMQPTIQISIAALIFILNHENKNY